MRQSESIISFAKAFVKAQAAMARASKDSENPHFKRKYASLASVWDAAKDALAKNGFCVIQGPCEQVGGVVLETMLLHESGEYIATETPILMKDNTAQAMGSAITYARRYGLAAILGVVVEDDDGNAATHGKDGDTKWGSATSQPQPVGTHRVTWDEFIREKNRLQAISGFTDAQARELFSVTDLGQIPQDAWPAALVTLKQFAEHLTGKDVAHA